MKLSLTLLSRCALACASFAVALRADTFTRNYSVDFFRDVPSRKLKGLATRSDGRLLAGPVFRDLAGTIPADLVWSLAPGASETQWFVGTGPEGRIFQVDVDFAKASYTAKELAKIDDTQIFALLRLKDGSFLAGTSPKGMLSLVRGGKAVAQTLLPADSVLDLLPLDDGKFVLAATGNPGEIYRIDVAKFAASGLAAKKETPVELAARGVSLFGEIKDRNVRRLALLPDGRVVAGSSPKGNLYQFPKDGGAPVFLMENKESEVTDLLVMPDGGLYASFVPAGTVNEARFKNQNRPNQQANGGNGPQGLPTPPGPSPMQGTQAQGDQSSSNEPFSGTPPEKFNGRGVLVHLPAGGFPEVVSSRMGQAFYHLALHGEWVLISGGEQGDLFGYDPVNRMALTFPGSVSAQLNELRAVSSSGDRYLVLRNNPTGFSVVDFKTSEPRSAETRKLDIGQAGTLGALRFGRLSDVAASQVSLEARGSQGADEVEGWTAWQSLRLLDKEGSLANVGWTATPQMKGRYVRLKVTLPPELPASASLDRAVWFYTPQNRRPQLTEFHTLSSNFELIPPPEPSVSTTQTLGQLLTQSGNESASDKRKINFQNSQIVPSPGMQVFYWTVTDPDGDSLAATFSLRKEGEAEWNTVAVDTTLPYAQIDISHLAEGLYRTRLVVREQAPRPEADRLSASFETDDLLIDRTPPAIVASEARMEASRLVIRVAAKDALSMIEGAEVVLNNGWRTSTEQPEDGIRDSREESFVIEIPRDRAAGATQAEVNVYDAIGNRSTAILRWK